MRIKTAILSIGLLGASIGMTAGEPQLVFDNGEAGQTIYKISEISLVRFDDGGMTVVGNGDETHFHTYASLNSLIFDTNGEYVETAVEKISVGTGRLRIALSPAKDAIRISGISDRATATIYSVSGAKALAVPATDGESIDITSLMPGIYIVTVGNQTVKFIK